MSAATTPRAGSRQFNTLRVLLRNSKSNRFTTAKGVGLNTLPFQDDISRLRAKGWAIQSKTGANATYRITGDQASSENYQAIQSLAKTAV